MMEASFITRDYSQDRLAIQEVFVENEYRLPTAFSKDDVILDIGANIGAFAVACLVRGAGHVFCFEPEPANCNLLRQNTAQFGDRVQIWEKAVWGKDQDLHLKVFDGYTAMHHTLGTEGHVVKGLDINTVLKLYPKFRLLKIDVEGAEKSIFEGCYSRGMENVAEICGEIHYQMAPGITDKWLKNELGRLGFEIVGMQPNPKSKVICLFFAKRKPEYK